MNVGELAQIACIWEATARKVGNVHPKADFAGTTYSDFLLSAVAIGRAMGAAELIGVGSAILEAVENTQKLVGQNTNLGIILLLAPLCAVPPHIPLREGIGPVLEGLTVEDARLAYEAIRRANPGGLGETAEQDVRAEPTVTLLEAMRLAADRDMVAKQYANGFSDVLGNGWKALYHGYSQHHCVEAAAVACQLMFLQGYHDSLIVRKLGEDVAEEVADRADSVWDLTTPAGRAAGRELDAYLRSDGHRLNPGTTADLVTACLFVALREGMLSPSAPFPWRVEDWL